MSFEDAASARLISEDGSQPEPDADIGSDCELPSRRSFFQRTFSKMEPGSVRGSILTLASSAIGAGALSIPLVNRECGVILGLLLVVFGAVLASYSLGLLVYCGNALGIYSYSQVVQHTWGSRLSAVLEGTLVIYGFGTLTAYMVVISKCLPDIFTAFHVHGMFARSSVDLCIITAIVIFPLCLLRSLAKLRYASLFAVIAMLYVTFAIVLRSIQHLDSPEADTSDWILFKIRKTLPQCMTIVVFAYTCHINVFSVYAELTNPIVRRMHKVVHRAVILEFLLYGAVGMFGYVDFLGKTKGNILNNYDEHDWLLTVGRIAVVFTLSLNSPLQVYPGLLILKRRIWSHLIPRKAGSGAVASLEDQVMADTALEESESSSTDHVERPSEPVEIAKHLRYQAPDATVSGTEGAGENTPASVAGSFVSINTPRTHGPTGDLETGVESEASDAPSTVSFTPDTVHHGDGKAHFEDDVKQPDAAEDEDSEDPFGLWRHAVLAALMVGAALVIAINVPQVSIVFSLLGATCSIMMCFIIPGLVFLRVADGPWTSCKKLTCISMMVFMSLVGPASVVLNLIDPLD